MKRQDIKKGPPAIGYLIVQRLRERSITTSPETHPDEDTITAFVEARLVAAEYLPLMSHLIECGVCRRATAQLVRLEFELDESDEEAAPFEEHSSRLGSFLSGLASHLVPSTEEDTVFAYQNPESETEQPTKSAADSEKADDDGSKA